MKSQDYRKDLTDSTKANSLWSQPLARPTYKQKGDFSATFPTRDWQYCWPQRAALQASNSHISWKATVPGKLVSLGRTGCKCNCNLGVLCLHGISLCKPDGALANCRFTATIRSGLRVHSGIRPTSSVSRVQAKSPRRPPINAFRKGLIALAVVCILGACSMSSMTRGAFNSKLSVRYQRWLQKLTCLR